MDQDVWQNILDKLEEVVNEQSFRTWFSETRLIDVQDDGLLVHVPTKFAADYLNQNYTELLSEISDALYQKSYKVRFTNNHNKTHRGTPDNTQHQPQGSVAGHSNLNKRYTFDQFVVGKSNNFAHSAALAVAETPGHNYNPLFIYGESGMGKTHLMQAIGNYIQSEGRNLNIYYTTSEEFTNEMIEALRANKMSHFRNKFRTIDLLLVDDIHFLSKKEGTQEEFFHTFNALYENRKQIVLTSDRPPKDIPDLENRLVTRFEWGLLADLKNPDFETRVAILRKKAEAENIAIPDSVLELVAENISNSVRALEGSLIRILAYASYNKLSPNDINETLAREILSDMISEKPKQISMDTIIQKVCNAYGITIPQMLDKTRKQNIAFPRQVAMYLANLLIPQMSLKEIAEYFKRKDHTTVLHAKKMIENQFRNDNDMRIQIEKLLKEIKG